jgi:predicted permease
LPLGKLLIAGQVALSLLLLVGAGLLVRNLRAVQHADPGLARDRLLMVDIDPSSRGYKDERLRAFVRELTSRLERLQGVTSVSYSENGIFSGTESQTTVQVEGFIAHHDEDTLSYYDHVGPNYVRTIGGRLLQGRDITAQDNEHAPRVALVNESFARFYFPGVSPLGKQLRFDSLSAEIVGVIADTKDKDLEAAPVRRLYLPYLHWVGQPGSAYFIVNAAGDPARLVNDVRRELRSLDAQLPIFGVDPLSLLMRQSLREQRLVARLASGFGVVALLLAAVGLYGVMTYAITRRTGEIGLRVALGAQRGDVLRMVLMEALRLVGAGIVVGLPIALLAVRLLRSQLHGVEASDPVAIGVALGVLLVSATLAALVPAMRASRVAPLVALRQE